MKRFRTLARAFASILTVLFLNTAVARAGLLPVTCDATYPPMSQSAPVRYSYGIELTSDSTLRNGDYFTVYDFQGFVPGSNTQPAGFSFSSAPLGLTPGGIAPNDNASVANLTWTYTGANPLAGPLNLGIFSAQTASPNVPNLNIPNGQFVSSTHRQIDGVVDANITGTSVPLPGSPIVPEPPALVLFGAGLPFLGLVRCLRAKA